MEIKLNGEVIDVKTLNNKEKMRTLLKFSDEIVRRRIEITTKKSLSKDPMEQLEIINNIKDDMKKRDLLAKDLEDLLE